MLGYHGWSVDLLLLTSVAIICAWPFRCRKDAETDEQQTPDEDNEKPQIDHLDWGVHLGSLGRYERAAESFRRAAELDPEDLAARFNLALALDLAGRHQEAREAYEHVLESDSSNADAHLNLSLALHSVGDTAGAHDRLRTALSLATDDATAHYNLGCLYAVEKQWTEAAAEFRLAANLDPKDAQTRFNLAIALRKAGQTAEAEPELRDFLALARGRYPEQIAYADELLQKEYDTMGGSDAS